MKLFLLDMNSTTLVSTIIASLMIGAFLATTPAISADKTQASVRDPLEFERAGPRERLTAMDAKLLVPLWKLVGVRSRELKSVSESLMKIGWTSGRTNE